ncbi:MAG: PAS domain S-box protein, partial [Methanoregula sp.]|nr:PAS domain S-box protein [Methanoregula sp.]
ENRYRTIFENTGTATVQVEENTMISLVNTEFERLSGFSKHEIEGQKSWTEFVVKADLEWMLDQNRMRMEGLERSLKNYEFRFITKSGDIRNIFLTVDMIPGTKKSVASLLDITERKCAENSLQESEDRYRQLVDISPDAVIIHREGKIIFVNPAALSLLGASNSDAVLNKPVLEFIQPDFRDAVRKTIEKDLGGDITPPMELHVLRVDGTSVIVEGRGVKTTIEGKPALQVAIRDITEHKRAEIALRESEATARALINTPTDSVILMDIQGVILELNETAAARFGKRSDELVGILADDLLPIEVARSRRTLVAQVLEKKKMVRFEDERDGSWYDTVAYPVISDTGEVKKIAIIARDITDRRTIEEALIHSEQRFRNLITAIGDIIWETDAHARFVYVSPLVETILGYTPDELIGHTPFEFLPQDAIVPNQKKFQTAVERHEKSVLHVSHWIHKGGNDVLLESYAIPMFDSNDSFSGFIGIDRKR